VKNWFLWLKKGDYELMPLSEKAPKVEKNHKSNS